MKRNLSVRATSAMCRQTTPDSHRPARGASMRLPVCVAVLLTCGVMTSALAQDSVVEKKELVIKSIGTKMKLLPAGSYLMGSTPDDADAEMDEKPQHKVTISRSFYLGVYEVTQHEYRQVMNDNPSHFKESELLPVEMVSWLDAVKFCNKLSKRERRRPYYKIEDKTVTILGGTGYRLPTEAEWEYACRAPQKADRHEASVWR